MHNHLEMSPPSAWVQRFAGLISSGTVLDLACGVGRHARYLAAMGHQVHALDRDAQALAQLATYDGAGATAIFPRQIDLEVPIEQLQWPFVAASLNAIIITNYLHRALFPLLLASLADGGFIIVETFAQGNGMFGKPSNPNFLLEPGELIHIMSQVPSMRIMAYEDGRVLQPKEAMVQRICAVKLSSEQEFFRLGLI